MACYLQERQDDIKRLAEAMSVNMHLEAEVALQKRLAEEMDAVLEIAKVQRAAAVSQNSELQEELDILAQGADYLDQQVGLACRYTRC
jgi:hypothetical protein